MKAKKRRSTPSVKIGNLSIGSNHPIAIQSMTDTQTSDIAATYKQIIELIKAGSDMVRITVNNSAAAQAVPKIIKKIRLQKYKTPIIGDFHFNGHTLLKTYPECARLLDKYRINPGNIGQGIKHDENFSCFIKIALKNNKPVRIGVNGGSVDQGLLTELMKKNAKRKNPKPSKDISLEAMIQSALKSALYAEKLGLKKNKIVLSIKSSVLQDTVFLYEELSNRCNYALHLGLTEAGGGTWGIASSSAAMAILLQKGIGDTLRISLTPEPNIKRSKEVDTCKALLQSMSLRYFQPSITSCPGCGRTSNLYFQKLAKDINQYVQKKFPLWTKQYSRIEKLRIAVMGCVVNGPGESRHANIGISLPGSLENCSAPVYIDGKKLTVLNGPNLKKQFIEILEEYISKKFPQR